MYLFTVCTLLISAVRSTEEAKSAVNPNLNTPQKPDVKDIVNQFKLVRPIISVPFQPEIVDDVSKPTTPPMMEAHILGARPSNGELNEKPSLWEHVVSSHSTSVRHPQPQPFSVFGNGVATNFGNAELLKLENLENPEIKGREPGQGGRQEISTSNPNPSTGMGDFNEPSFIQTKQIQLDPTRMIQETGVREPSQNTFGAPLPVEWDSTKAPVRTTTKYQMDGLDGSNPEMTGYPQRLVVGLTKEERQDRLRDAKIRLGTEINTVRDQIRKEIGEIGLAKELADRMNVLLDKYEKRMAYAQKHRLSEDEVEEVRSQFKRLALQNLNGFRTAPTQFPGLEKVNVEELRNLFKKIEAEVHNKNHKQ